MPRTKRDVAELKKRAINSLVLGIELFNRPHEDGRPEGTLILLHHAFEMILKAVIKDKTGTVHAKGEKYSYGFDLKWFHNLIGSQVFSFLRSSIFLTRSPAMSRHSSELTDTQWSHIAPLLPKPQASANGGPKPIPNRPVFEGILWVLRSGARWKDLPEQYPSPSTCWRRLRAWEADGIWLKAWRALLRQLDAQGQLDWAETFADGSFAPAKKGGIVSAKPPVERVRSGWWWSTAKVFLWETTWTRRPVQKSR